MYWWPVYAVSVRYCLPIKVLFQRHTFLIDLQIVYPFAYRNICLEETLELPVFPGTAHIFVFLFVFGVSIILMNLLVGLAVSDIQEYYLSNIIAKSYLFSIFFLRVNKELKVYIDSFLNLTIKNDCLKKFNFNTILISIFSNIIVKNT